MQSLSENDYLLIEKFINNELSNEERVLLNERRKDPAFSKELKLHQDTGDAIKEYHSKTLRTELKQRVKEIPVSDLRARRRSIFMYWAAASVMVCAIAGYFILRSGSSSDKNLFDSYFKAFPATIITRGNDDESSDAALKKYEKGDYEGAALIIQPLIEKEKNIEEKHKLKLLLGNCWLKLNETHKAKKCFKEIMEDSDTQFRQHGEWYFALSLLKNKQRDSSQLILDKIIHSNSIYARQADDLSKKLSRTIQ
jgi:hypothetical protein